MEKQWCWCNAAMKINMPATSGMEKAHCTFCSLEKSAAAFHQPKEAAGLSQIQSAFSSSPHTCPFPLGAWEKGEASRDCYVSNTLYFYSDIKVPSIHFLSFLLEMGAAGACMPCSYSTLWEVTVQFSLWGPFSPWAPCWETQQGGLLGCYFFLSCSDISRPGMVLMPPNLYHATPLAASTSI